MSDQTIRHEATEASQSPELSQEASSLVSSPSTDFMPTPAMVRFRNELIVAPTTRHSIQEICRRAGLHEKTYFKWSSRHKKSFKRWVWEETESLRLVTRMRLEAIGMDKAETDFRYWSKMVDILSLDDPVVSPTSNPKEELQRIVASYSR